MNKYRCMNCGGYATFHKEYGRWWLAEDCDCGEFQEADERLAVPELEEDYGDPADFWKEVSDYEA